VAVAVSRRHSRFARVSVQMRVLQTRVMELSRWRPLIAAAAVTVVVVVVMRAAARFVSREEVGDRGLCCCGVLQVLVVPRLAAVLLLFNECCERLVLLRVRFLLCDFGFFVAHNRLCCVQPQTGGGGSGGSREGMGFGSATDN
jgi:hypothetical protein